MKVALIGATGFVGAKILDEAISRGHRVTPIVRNPDALRGGVTGVKVDVLDVDALAKALEGHDAVISAFNPGRGTPGDGIYDLFVAGHRAIIDAVKKSGVTRYLAVGGAGSLKTPEGVEMIDSPSFPEHFRPYLGGIRGTREQYYMLKAEPGLDWVFLAPSAFLEPGERTGKYRVGKDHLLANEHGESRISLEDYAVAMIDELEQQAHHSERFTVGY
ncbi:MAG: NAD(P)-dependent oxidoreductase [Caulobacteraceae bacterium]